MSVVLGYDSAFLSHFGISRSFSCISFAIHGSASVPPPLGHFHAKPSRLMGCRTAQITSEALLQFLLSAIEPLYGGPAGYPVTAMRLLLACGYVASEEAHLELLSYTFFEEVRIHVTTSLLCDCNFYTRDILTVS